MPRLVGRALPDSVDPFHDHDPVTLLTSFVFAKDPRDIDVITQFGRLSQKFGATASIVRFVLERCLQTHLRGDIVRTDCQTYVRACLGQAEDLLTRSTLKVSSISISMSARLTRHIEQLLCKPH